MQENGKHKALDTTIFSDYDVRLIKYCRKLVDVLESAERIGHHEDIPERAKYIQISDTLVKQICKTLREYTTI